MRRENIAAVNLTADPPRRHPGNLHVRFEGVEADDLLARLQPHVFAATGSACTSGHTHHSHVLDAIGQSAATAGQGVRFSLGRFTTDDEVQMAVKLIREKTEQMSRGVSPQELGGSHSEFVK